MQNASSSWLIGSSESCDIRVSAPAVSGMHCRLTCSGNSYQLIDLDSTNGTFVDGQKLTPYQPVAVSPSQHVTLATSVDFPWDRIQQASSGEPSGHGQTVALHREAITIGRTTDNDVVVGLGIVSGHHARIFRQDHQFFIEDTNSLNGVYINGTANRIVAPTPISARDEIYLGSYRLAASDLLAKFSTTSPTFIGQQELKNLEFQGDSMTIGRDPACDHPIDFPVISWHHARITRSPQGIYVEDLKSRNGTFVDGKRISAKTLIQPGQQIVLGNYRFQLLEGGQIAQHRDTGYTIEARNVTFATRSGKQILAPISFTAYPGELIALMGTSGAGKTTLLKILNGYTPPSEGEVLYNGKNLYQNYDEHSSLIGYVPQDDIVHERLQVGEALAYSARLRTDYTEQEIDTKARRVADALGLLDKFDELIGSPENKTLSGGQRKRVNIALELTCDTPVLYLDEPTSGLSSADAEEVVENLRKLAKESGKTIIATIHAPSLETYKKFDSVILLSKDKVAPGAQEKPGTMIYYGPACPGSLEFVASHGGTDPVDDSDKLTPDYMMKALQPDKNNPDPQNTSDNWFARYRQSKFYQQFVVERSGQTTTPAGTNSTTKASRIDWGQWMTLARRNVTIRFRDRSQVLIMLLQAPIFAALIWGIYGCLPGPAPHRPLNSDIITNANGIHFLLVVAAIWFGCNNAVRDVVGEWLIYKRERMVCLGLCSYVFSKLVVLNAICLFQCLTMLGIVYPACGLSGGFEHCFLVLWMASLVGASIGLLISSAPFCKTTESAIALLPIVLLPMIGLGGGLRPSYQMPTPALALSYALPSRWAFEANLVREAEKRTLDNGAIETFEPPQMPINPQCAPSKQAATDASSQSGDLAEQTFPKFVNGDKASTEKDSAAHKHRHHYEDSLLALAAMFLVCISGVLVSLKSRDKTLGY